MHIATRLMLILVGTVLLIVLAYGVVSHRQRTELLREEIARSTRVLGRTLQAGVEQAVQEGRGTDAAALLVAAQGGERGGRGVVAALFDPEGEVVAGSAAEVACLQRHLAAAAAAEPGEAHDEPRGWARCGSELFWLALPLSPPGGSLLVAQRAFVLEQSAAEAMQRQLALSLALLLAIGGLLPLILRGTYIQPIEKIMRGLGTLGEQGEAGQPAHIQAPGSAGELAQLVEALNEVSEQLAEKRRELVQQGEEKLALERRVREAEKFAVIGRVSGGLAHELGSPLSVIGIRAQAIQHTPGTSPALQEHAGVIHAQVRRVTDFIQGLLHMAQQHGVVFRPVDLTELLPDVLEEVEPRARTEEVRLELRMPEEPVIVHGEEMLLRHAVRNLVRNALHALEDHVGERRIRVRLEVEEHEVRVLVEDTGPGIPSANLSNVFEPFYTTKGIGQGMGLGLPITRGIIEQHGGELYLENLKHRGLRAVMGLPRVPGTAREEGNGEGRGKREEGREERRGKREEGRGKRGTVGEERRSGGAGMRGSGRGMVEENDRNPGKADFMTEMLTETGGERILVVEDDAELRQTLEALLTAHGYETVTSPDGRHALRQLQHEAVDLVVTDLCMPGLGGEALLEQVRATFTELPVITMTGFGSVPNAVSLTRAGAADYLTKPLEIEPLLGSIRRVLEETRPAREEARVRQRVGEHAYGLIGRSPGMLQLQEQIPRIAPSPAPLLITGETGTGKELVARAIHSASGLGSFVAINCGAIPANLIESELFGYAKGAFTGADRDRRGLLEEAHGGTLFLDEIAELPIVLQSKLLRVLQFGELRRLGDVKVIKVKARLLAATHRDLEVEIRENRFRQDLFFRINVLRLEVPPLRERATDIPLLANHFLAEVAKREGRKDLRLAPEVVEVLTTYPWPGNVRELQNVIERAAILAPAPLIGLEELPDELRARAPSRTHHPLVGEDVTVADLERQHILAVLERVNGNRSRAAEVLGLPRRTLYRRLEEYGMGEAM